jgi:hypothetical protein
VNRSIQVDDRGDRRQIGRVLERVDARVVGLGGLVSGCTPPFHRSPSALFGKNSATTRRLTSSSTT